MLLYKRLGSGRTKSFERWGSREKWDIRKFWGCEKLIERGKNETCEKSGTPKINETQQKLSKNGQKQPNIFSTIFFKTSPKSNIKIIIFYVGPKMGFQKFLFEQSDVLNTKIYILGSKISKIIQRWSKKNTHIFPFFFKNTNCITFHIWALLNWVT